MTPVAGVSQRRLLLVLATHADLSGREALPVSAVFAGTRLTHLPPSPRQGGGERQQSALMGLRRQQAPHRAVSAIPDEASWPLPPTLALCSSGPAQSSRWCALPDGSSGTKPASPLRAHPQRECNSCGGHPIAHAHCGTGHTGILPDGSPLLGVDPTPEIASTSGSEHATRQSPCSTHRAETSSIHAEAHHCGTAAGTETPTASGRGRLS